MFGLTVRRVLTFAVCAVLIGVISVGVFAWANGVRFFAVETGSMSPAIRAGDLVIDAPTTVTTIYRVGDVITFHPTPGYTTTHRVAALDPDGIATKGDANPTADLGQIPASSVIGRVIAVVPYGGTVVGFLRQPIGLVTLLLVIVAGALAWEIVKGDRPAAATLPAIAPDEALQ